jgi:YVTN family beta-propeller protein
MKKWSGVNDSKIGGIFKILLMGVLLFPLVIISIAQPMFSNLIEAADQDRTKPTNQSQTDSLDDSKPEVISTIKIGKGGIYPVAVAVNPLTNRIYVANNASNNVSVIDGSTDIVVDVIEVEKEPSAVAVNPVTNKVYVTNWNSQSVSVIDGSTQKILATIDVGMCPGAITINPNTNRIYVANVGSQNVSVIDGSSNSIVATINTGADPRGVAVNTTTNKIYVASGAIIVINGITNQVEFTGGNCDASFIGVNSATNRVYLGNTGMGIVRVIDGSTNDTINTLKFAQNPTGIVVNSNTNCTYVVEDQRVEVINGTTDNLLTSIPVGTTAVGLAINPITNRIYTASYSDNSVSEIDGNSDSIVAKISLGMPIRNITVNTVTNYIYAVGGDITVINGRTDKVKATIKVGSTLRGVAVNPATNRIYVGDYSNNTVLVINGSSNKIVAKINVGIGPNALAVDTVTNRIYVANLSSDYLSIIDGTSNSVISTLDVGTGTNSIAVDSVKNLIYTTNSEVLAIDGYTGDIIARMNAGMNPQDITLNPKTNQIYVSDAENSVVAVIDSATNTVTDVVKVGLTPHGIALNTTSNRIYVVNAEDNDLSVIDGFTNKVTSTVNVELFPEDVAANQDTNKVYVANSSSGTISVIRDALSLVTRSLDIGYVKTPYNMTFKATGIPPYKWAITPTTELPPGLTLKTNKQDTSFALISGKPIMCGDFIFTIQVTDSRSTNLSGLESTALAPPNGCKIAISTIPKDGQSNFREDIITNLDNYTEKYQATEGITDSMDKLDNREVNTSSIAGNTTYGTFTLTIYPELNIILPGSTKTLTTLPAADNNSAYTCALEASGGKGPYVWFKGTNFPTWLNINTNTGTLNGTPQKVEGILKFSIIVTDNLNKSITKTVSLKVNKALTIATVSLPFCYTGMKYKTTTLKTSGGSGKYTWTVNHDELPNGLTWDNQKAEIAGTTLGPSGSFRVSFQVSDGITSVTKTLSISVYESLAITSVFLSPDIVSKECRYVLTANGGSGGYKWTLTGNLPPGLIFDKSANIIAGTLTKAGTYRFTIKVTDSLNGTAAIRVALVVNAGS